MIKVIISHDVDHLFAKDHWFRDLIYPKLWVRSTIQLIRREITLKEWWLRCISCFRKNRHNLDALMDFDENHGVKSTFFFGMNQGLGMSYKPEEAKSTIIRVHNRGFATGVHGIEYQDYDGMKKEYDTFKNTTGFEPCGIRMHYVRFDDNTFEKLSQIGYPFDTTEFDKQNNGTRKNPYKIGNMWEFPLTIMDAYLPNKFEAAKEVTLNLLEESKRNGLQYVTILFHDNQFNKDYQNYKQWYEWLIQNLAECDEYEFVTFQQAIDQLLKVNKRIRS